MGGVEIKAKYRQKECCKKCKKVYASLAVLLFDRFLIAKNAHSTEIHEKKQPSHFRTITTSEKLTIMKI